ncbi:hypothetical protein CJJ23_01945 [Mycoplasmopsis agassizii]|uniref:HMA domain-containing protein n=1 Tax=Mycoplasmopsis agassizii TaxID=33922 RepID=A0A269TJ04_9BACT|nr:heavy-metal-associated domain-containing protein [Mycoplasmopsis agassizii]PAK21391.1 hypothetical protein CJJ23_01945 [Mycoplasmopsis agassizii]
MQLLKLTIEELHCSSCVATIEQLFKDLENQKVLKVTSIIANKSVKINFDESKISKSEILDMLDQAGLEYNEL